MSLSKEEQKRYSRHILLEEIGYEGQKKLKNARVLVIGAGGLGCPILQYLTASGIGTIGIIDFDTVDESNLQRQILFNLSHIGVNKAIAAKEQLEQLNPLVTINCYAEKLNKKNALSLFKAYDIIIDGTDNFSTRYLVNDAAVLTNKPFVYGSIYRFEGQVSVFNYQNGPTYRCLFPAPPSNASPNCAQSGVLSIVPSIIGSYQANEALKLVLGIGEPLSAKLFLLHTQSNSSSVINIKRNQEQIDKVLQYGLQNDYEDHCNEDESINTISAIELKELLSEMEDFQLIDVRESYEEPKLFSSRTLSIPLNELDKRHNEIDQKKMVVLFCQSGIRSRSAIQQLKNKQPYSNLYSLEGGLNAWLKLTETEMV